MFEPLHQLRSRLVALFRRRRLERDLEDELSFHVSMREERLRAINTPDARAAARRGFGSLARWAEECREVWTFGVLESFLQDLRLGLRALMKRPFLFFVAIVSVAIGIGLNVSTFSAFKQFLLGSSLSGAQPDSRLVAITPEVSFPNYEDLRGTDGFEGIAAMQAATLLWRTENGTVSINAKVVSRNFFEVVGVRPVYGRSFDPTGEPQILLSFPFWQRRFGGDTAIIGETLSLNGGSFVVSGVLPAGYNASVGPLVAPNIYVTISPLVCQGLTDRGAGQFDLVARIRDGVTAQKAAASLTNNARELARQFPVENGLDRSISLTPATGLNMWLGIFGGVVVSIAAVIYIVLTLVLLVACANVAGVLLTRAQERYREFAVCAALGATRWRLIQRTVAESAIIAGFGGIVGLGLYQLVLVTVRRIALTRDIEVISPALPFIYCCGVILLVIVACSIAPAFAISQVAPGPALTSSGKTVGRRSIMRPALVVFQMAVCFLFLTGACVLIHGFLRLRTVEPGFDVDHTVSLRVRMTAVEGAPVSVGRSFSDIRRLLLELPGVQSVSSVRFLPLSIFSSKALIHPEGAANVGTTVNVHPVGPHYLETMRIPILRGRDVSDEDVRISRESVLPVIMNNTLTHQLFQSSDPIGRRIVLERGNSRDPERVMQIVGVAADSKLHSLNEQNEPVLYLPEVSTSFVLRVAGSPQSFLRSIERIVSDNAPGASVQTNPMSVEVASALLPTKIGGALLAGLSAVSLVLAMLGLYAVVSSAVERRRFEIGVRVALGASTGNVLWTILKEAAVVLGIGSAIGGLISLPLMRLLSPLAIERSSIDSSAFLFAAALLILISICASFSPARRVARMDPSTVLRHD